MVSIPDGLEEDVGESEDEQVLHRLLAEKMIDPEDLVLVEVAVEDLVELDGAGEIASERFLDNEAAIGGEPDSGKARGDVVEQRRGIAMKNTGSRASPSFSEIRS